VTEERPSRDRGDRVAPALVAALLGAGVLGVVWLQPRLAATVHAVKAREDVYVLPPPEELRAATLGYRAAATDLLWAKLLVENGIHWSEHRPFPDLNRYLDAIYALEPNFAPLYQYVDTLLVYRPLKGTEQDARDARAYLEKGTRARPDDYQVWRQYGQFLAFLGPSYLASDDEKLQWKKDGVAALERSVELGGYTDEAFTVASMLSGRFGERDAAIRTLQRNYALTDDEAKRAEISARLEVLNASQEQDDTERAIRTIEARWRKDFPFLPRGEFLQLGPSPDTLLCAGLRASGTPACTHDWDDVLAPIARESSAAPR
jgi:hypothetical protein